MQQGGVPPLKVDCLMWRLHTKSWQQQKNVAEEIRLNSVHWESINPVVDCYGSMKTDTCCILKNISIEAKLKKLLSIRSISFQFPKKLLLLYLETSLVIFSNVTSCTLLLTDPHKLYHHDEITKELPMDKTCLLHYFLTSIVTKNSYLNL